LGRVAGTGSPEIVGLFTVPLFVVTRLSPLLFIPADFYLEQRFGPTSCLYSLGLFLDGFSSPFYSSFPLQLTLDFLSSVRVLA